MSFTDIISMEFNWLTILEICLIIAVLFIGYLLFGRYMRARSRLARDKGHLITKIYKDLEQFDYEAPKMYEGGYRITYVAWGRRYFITEGKTLEQIRAGVLSQLPQDKPQGFIVNYSR